MYIIISTTYVSIVIVRLSIITTLSGSPGGYHDDNFTNEKKSYILD